MPPEDFMRLTRDEVEKQYGIVRDFIQTVSGPKSESMKKELNSKILNTIVRGDSLFALDGVAPDSVDLVLTDPPYFLDKLDENWNHKTVSNKSNQYTVKSLPAGMKFDRDQGKRFYDWYLKISGKILRVLKPGGFFFSFSSPRLYHRMASAMDDAGFLIRDSFLWLYT